jgi:hypothetical protein
VSFTRRNGDCVVSGDFDLLNNLVKELGKDYYVDVGILGQERAENGMTLAGIGAVHEFGSPVQKIPERSFIRKPIQNRQHEIVYDVQGNAGHRMATGDVRGIFKDIGIACEQQIQAAFDTSGFGGWSPLSENYKVRPSGKPVAESSKPLIDTGALRKAITSKVGVI